jgi:phosphatidylglycerophosphate synthase
MWLAHALTLSRIPIAIALIYSYGDPAWSIALVALAALTDAADGNVARWMQRRGRTRPAIGGWLDPLVDKIFVAIVAVVIWVESRDLVVIALIGARELVLVPLVAIYLARHRPVRELRADPIGKAATIAQFVALAVAVAMPRWALPGAITAAGLGLAAVAHYVSRELRAPRGTPT